MSKPTSEKEEVKCFVIMPISNQYGYDDGHFTLVYEDIIKPAIQANNMKPIRADETKNTNLIQLDILKKIIETPIAICDMSSKNPNVFYELGMRQAFNMPTVLIKDEETSAPFDISGLRYITYNKNMKHREVKSAVEELTKCINETYSKKDDKSEINSLIRLMELVNPPNNLNSQRYELIKGTRKMLDEAENLNDIHSSSYWGFIKNHLSENEKNIVCGTTKNIISFDGNNSVNIKSSDFIYRKKQISFMINRLEKEWGLI